MIFSLKNKMYKEVLWSFLTKGLTLVLFLLINIILARKLGIESFGSWSLFLSVITVFFTFSYFGINASSKKFIAQHSKTENLKNILLSSIKLRFLFSFIFSLLLLLFYRQIASYFGDSNLERLFLYGVPLVFLSGFVEYFKDVFIGLYRIKYNFIINTCEFGLKFILILFFLFFSSSVISVINSFSLALFITTIIGFYLLYFNFYKDLKGVDKNFKKDILNYSYPLIFVSLGFIILTEIDTIMIGYFLSPIEVGVYAIAKQIIIKLPHIALAISMGTMPIFAKLNNENKKELKIKLFKILRINSYIYLAIVLILLLLSPLFVPLLFGFEYIKSVMPLQILSIYLFCMATSIILCAFLDYVGKAKVRAYNIIITIILNIILNILLIPRYGVNGAALATSISYLPYVILNWVEVRKFLR